MPPCLRHRLFVLIVMSVDSSLDYVDVRSTLVLTVVWRVSANSTAIYMYTNSQTSLIGSWNLSSVALDYMDDALLTRIWLTQGGCRIFCTNKKQKKDFRKFVDACVMLHNELFAGQWASVQKPSPGTACKIYLSQLINRNLQHAARDEASEN